ncbi:MAG: hypothetical protein ABII82_01995, partial [Verrucomicrobiota bacterium]
RGDTAPYTELWLAERLAAAFCPIVPEFVFDVDLADWLAYDPIRGLWVHGSEHLALQKAAAVARVLFATAQSEADAKLAIKFFQRRTLLASLALAGADRRIARRNAEFDADSNLLHCANGVLALDRLTLRPHSAGYYLTRSTRTEFRPAAWRGSLFERVVAESVPSTVHEWLQQTLGKALLGQPVDDVILHAIGPPGMGKSTTYEAISAALGSYAGTIPRVLFTEGDRAASEALEKLRGLRLAIAAELPTANRPAIAVLKAVAGGDLLTSRQLYARRGQDWRASCLVVVYANSVPNYRGDEGLRRRVRAVRYERAPANPDPAIRPRLQNDPDERAATLSWLVEGLASARASQLPTPPEVTAYSSEVMDSADPLSEILGVFCEITGESDDCISHRQLGEYFERWQNDNRISERERISRRGLLSALRARTGVREYRTGKERGLQGVRLCNHQDMYGSS